MQPLPIFVINLDVQPERHSYMMAAFGALDLDFVHVCAVDGSRLSPQQLRTYSISNSGYRWATGEIGCLLSHASVWQRMVDENIPLAAIFEDDVRIARQLPELLAHLDVLPAGMHALKLETLGTAVDIDEEPACVIDPIKICRLRSKHLGSAGYLVTLEGAKAFLGVTRAPRRPVDHHMFDPLLAGHSHLAIYQAMPALIVQRGREAGQDATHSMFSSVIDGNNTSRHHKTIPIGQKLKRELFRPWRQVVLALKRMASRRRHGATTVVVPFIGDGVLDCYVARIGQTGTSLEDVARRLRC
ncbi:MAG: glycosyltransferase family 25 protein [Ancalomicrobiaceae bacterium]|nr:glycosyltransferase family 25 protein [Ancalomicrobiaceae bacterium]